MVLGYLLIGYIMGNVQAAYLIARWIKKEDIRNRGNGNAGASNATLVYGWKYGVIIGLIDILKAYLAIILAKALLAESDLGPALSGLGVFLGHCYPFYMGFRGGKGTACIVGILMAMGWLPLLVGAMVIVTITIATDYIAFGTLALSLVLIIFTYLQNRSFPALALTVIITFLSFTYHIPNYKRIYLGTESKLSHSLKR